MEPKGNGAGLRRLHRFLRSWSATKPITITKYKFFPRGHEENSHPHTPPISPSRWDPPKSSSNRNCQAMRLINGPSKLRQEFFKVWSRLNRLLQSTISGKIVLMQKKVN